MDRSYGVLFDLDGTLWEVTNTTFESANCIAEKYNLNKISKDTICKVMGLNKYDCAKLYFPDINQDKALYYLEEISKLNIKRLNENGGNLYSNIESTLIKLNENYELFIVSNSAHKEYIEAFLNSSGLNKYFKSYVAASELNISKADAIKMVINNNKLVKAIYVGDTKKDQEASVLVEIPFIQAKYGFGENLNSEYSINSFSELPKVVKEIMDFTLKNKNLVNERMVLK